MLLLHAINLQHKQSYLIKKSEHNQRLLDSDVTEVKKIVDKRKVVRYCETNIT